MQTGWTIVFVSGTDYESELVRARLDDASIPVVLMNKRDHAFCLTHGMLARVAVLVPDAFVAQATKCLETPPISQEELTAIALGNDPKG